MHVLIYDPQHKGHHLNWVRLLANACAPYASRITFVTGAQAPASPEFAEQLKSMPANFSVDSSMASVELRETPLESVFLSRRVWKGLQQAIRRHRPDHVYLLYADMLTLSGLTLPPGTMRLPIDPSQIDAIFVGASFAYPGLPLRRRLRCYFELRGVGRLPAGRLLFIDPIVHEWLQENRPSLARRSKLLPDPVTPVGVYEKRAARAELGLPVDGRWISSVGVLDSRKGVDDFVTAFAAAGLDSSDRLLLAGRASPSVLSAVAAAKVMLGEGRIYLLDRLLSNREFDLAISAADLVAVSHRFPDHLGSASVLIRATAAGRPVLSSERAWPGYVTRKHSLGWIYPHAPEGRPQSIAQSMADADSFILPPQAKAFAAFHSVARFGEILTEPLLQAAVASNVAAG